MQRGKHKQIHIKIDTFNECEVIQPISSFYPTWHSSAPACVFFSLFCVNQNIFYIIQEVARLQSSTAEYPV